MDIIGRQKTLQLATLIVWTGYVFLWALRTFIQKMAAFGFATGCDGAFTTLFILGMNEATRKKDSNYRTPLIFQAVTSKFRSSLVTLSFLGYAGGSVILGLMSFIFTTADSLSFACIFLMVIGSFLNFIIMKEPPRYLFRKGRISDGFKSLHYIAKKNKTGLSKEKILELMNYPYRSDESRNPFKHKIVQSTEVDSKSK